MVAFVQQNWLTLALLAMVCLSVANVSLKVLFKQQAFAKIDWGAWLPIAVVVVLAFAIAYAVFSPTLGIKQDATTLFVVWLVFSIASFALVFLALEKGKVALVNTILSLSIVVVAFLSFVFLGDRFEAKEIAAMLFALFSILILLS